MSAILNTKMTYLGCTSQQIIHKLNIKITFFRAKNIRKHIFNRINTNLTQFRWIFPCVIHLTHTNMGIGTLNLSLKKYTKIIIDKRLYLLHDYWLFSRLASAEKNATSNPFLPRWHKRYKIDDVRCKCHGEGMSKIGIGRRLSHIAVSAIRRHFHSARKRWPDYRLLSNSETF